MTVKELIEMLKTCDEESIVYIDYNGDINSIKLDLKFMVKQLV